MGDGADYWRDVGPVMAAASKRRRSRNREYGAYTLTRLGVDFDTKNDGAHLVVRHGGAVADYWPGTGKWRVRGTTDYRRGIRGLLDRLGVHRG